MTPGRAQLSTWSAAKPCSKSTAGPEPCTAYAMRVPSNERTWSTCVSAAAPRRLGMKGTLRCGHELGAERVEMERVGVGHGEERDASKRADQQRRLRLRVDVAPDLSALDALAQVV